MKPPHFLIVEDSLNDTHFLCKTLERFVGAQFTCIQTAREAFALSAVTSFAAAFVNLKLGIVRDAGLQVIWHLRKLSTDLPIWVVTGASDDVMRRRALQAGATGFFGKDFNDTDRLAVLRTLEMRFAAYNQGRRLKHKWTTIGGTIDNIGTGLVGLSLVPGSTNMTAAEDMKIVLIIGFILQIIGKQIQASSAADAKVVDTHMDQAPPPPTP